MVRACGDVAADARDALFEVGTFDLASDASCGLAACHLRRAERARRNFCGCAIAETGRISIHIVSATPFVLPAADATEISSGHRIEGIQVSETGYDEIEDELGRGIQ
jgi:hypothetical protein